MTAVEWFAYNDAQATLDYAEGKITELVFAVQKMAILQQALEMEKKQMDKVAGDWWREGADFVSNVKREYVSFNQYYAIKFGKGTDL